MVNDLHGQIQLIQMYHAPPLTKLCPGSTACQNRVGNLPHASTNNWQGMLAKKHCWQRRQLLCIHEISQKACGFELAFVRFLTTMLAHNTRRDQRKQVRCFQVGLFQVLALCRQTILIKMVRVRTSDDRHRSVVPPQLHKNTLQQLIPLGHDLSQLPFTGIRERKGKYSKFDQNLITRFQKSVVLPCPGHSTCFKGAANQKHLFASQATTRTSGAVPRGGQKPTEGREVSMIPTSTY